MHCSVVIVFHKLTGLRKLSTMPFGQRFPRWSSTGRFHELSDISAVLHALPMNTCDRLVAAIEGFIKRRVRRGYPEHPTTGRQPLAASGNRRACVKYFDALLAA